MAYKPLYDADYFRRLLKQLELMKRKKKSRKTQIYEMRSEKEAEK